MGAGFTFSTAMSASRSEKKKSLISAYERSEKCMYFQCIFFKHFSKLNKNNHTFCFNSFVFANSGCSMISDHTYVTSYKNWSQENEKQKKKVELETDLSSQV